MSFRSRLVSPKFENQLKAYGVAALAAGVGMLAPQADAEIVYTPTRILFQDSVRYFDIDHDGINDFRIQNYAASYTFAYVNGRESNAIAITRNSNPCALPLKSGDSIGPSLRFSNSAEVAGQYLSFGCIWPKNHYLAFRFTKNGGTHYGWMRISIIDRGGYGAKVGIEGYAYETTPDKSIVAGQTQES